MDHVLVISLSVEIIAVRQYPCDGFMDFERNAYKKKFRACYSKSNFKVRVLYEMTKILMELKSVGAS